ncbi:DUF4280 domain-containing protein [Tumidithrix elongata RA019]|uniref:DUF4280 domain-containing protein n=1 Tax=Tumidithrix elongata BACA0141 TaxID=2716417 RepID=A0AAW9PY01_9CYAN|nr:DUF4280 domain-containing protein [Tumidithrix elongata RA019]
MAVQVVMGATMTCSFGVSPSSLIVIPKGLPVMVGGVLAATIMDFAPIANIPPFGMCNSMANPVVSAATTAATAAALGVFTFTPMPCVPLTTPWKPGSPTVMINNFPALNNSCTCNCAWGGVITIGSPGQGQTMVA